MYVIYINDRPLCLRGRDAAAPPPDLRTENHLEASYTGKRKHLLNYADMLEKGRPKITSLELIGDDVERLWTDFRSHYKWVEAAGGIVTNVESGKQLFIFRRGFWDLPKGKLDKGESGAEAAVREVKEETGLTDLILGDPLPTTYHTYRTKKHRVLKPTYWFAMSSRQMTLMPEDGEGIELAQWRTVAEVLAEDAPIYASLRALLKVAKTT